MSTYLERQKELLAGRSSTVKTRQQALVDAPTTSSLPDNEFESFKTSFIDQRRKFIDSQTLLPTKTPTYTEIQTKRQQLATPTATAPTTFGLNTNKDMASRLMGMEPIKKEAAKRDFFTALGVGTEKTQPLGKQPDGLIQSVKEGGAIGFLYGTTLQSGEQRRAERYEKLVGQGIEPERAYTIAEAWSAGRPLPTDTTPEEKSSMKWFTATENAFIALELANFAFVGKPINAALKTLKRGAQNELFRDVALAADATVARKIITTKYPQLAGTEGVNDLITLAQKVGSNDSWREVVAQTKTGRELLEGKVGGSPVVPDTTAQQIFYDKGVPVLRGGAKSNANEIVSTRDEVSKVLRGEVEEARLSNLDVLQSEIKAGALPFKQTAEDMVPVFSPRNTGRLWIGQQVTLDRTLAEGLASTAKDVRELSLKADDLVRLSDGTFVYAPKAQVSKGLTPSLQGVIKTQRANVAKIEADRVAKEVAARKAEASAVAREQDAVTNAARSARIQSQATREAALRAMTEAPKQAIAKVAELRVAKTEAIEKLNATVRTANATLRSAQTKVDTLVRKIKDAPTVDVKKGYQEKLNAARKILDEAKASMPNKVDLEKQKLTIRTEYGTKIKATNAEARQAVKEAKTVSEGGVTTSKSTKVTTKSVTETDKTIATIVQTLKPAKGNKNALEPLQGGVTTTASAFAKRIKEEASDMLARVGGDISAIPEHHAVLTNEAQMAKAFEYVSVNPEQAYLDFINANFKGETSRAAVYNVLTKTDFLKNDAVRMENVIRTFFKEGTRLAQELQARQIVGHLDYATIVGRLLNMSDTIAKKRGINLGKETETLIQKFGDTLDQIPANSKSAITKAVDEITCK